jgi:serine O-acetyltransferase
VAFRHCDEGATISASEPDWSRERPSRWWDPTRRLLAAIRRYQAWGVRGGIIAKLLGRACLLRHHFWSAITGAEIPASCRIGGGLLIPHPNGIVLNGHVTIGPNCLIFQQVTLGDGGSIPGVPTIGGHVDIGAGAKVLGGIHIGDHAKIGANAVVLCDVPAYATAVGVPARIIPGKAPGQGPETEPASDADAAPQIEHAR